MDGWMDGWILNETLLRMNDGDTERGRYLFTDLCIALPRLEKLEVMEEKNPPLPPPPLRVVIIF